MHLPDRRLILLGYALFVISGVLLRPLMPIDETRYLSVAWEMRLGDHWIVPFKNGLPYDHKPPLLFWLINLVWIPGVSEFTGRLVAPAFSLATIWATGRTSDLMGLDGRTGTASMLILATFACFQFFGLETGFDSMLSLAVVLAVAQLWKIGTSLDYRTRDWALLGAALALGLMSKGPVLFVHVLPSLLLLRLWAPQGPRALRGTGVALAVCAGLVFVWLLPALILGGPDYREAVLWTQSAGRAVSSFAHAQPFWYYLILLPVLVFPWGWMPGFWKRLPLDAPEKLLLITTLGPLLLFSIISGKQLNYLLPETPWLAILLARRFPQVLGRGWGAVAVLVLLGLAFPVMGFGLLGNEAERMVSLPAALLASGALIGGAVLIARRPTLVWLTATIALTALHLSYAVGPATQIMSPRQIAERIVSADGRIGIASSVYHSEFHFLGRLTEPFDMLADEAEIAAFADANPDGLILGRLKADVLPAWEPRDIIYYRNDDWAIWSSMDRK
jgi:4-amino-4-deoxy-L-arabinose transferase-like glycosyltransferase